MSSKTGAAPASSSGPVVRTRVASRAPEVHVRFPEARAAAPSLLPRWGRSWAGFASAVSWRGVGMGVLIGLVASTHLRLREAEARVRNLQTYTHNLMDADMVLIDAVRAAREENESLARKVVELEEQVRQPPRRPTSGSVVLMQGDPGGPK